MNLEIMQKKATEILSCQIDNLEEKIIENQDAVYYRNKSRGGGALIISNSGEMLFVDPFFVDYQEHLLKFMNGERSQFE